jgi:UDP-2,4-diacetamido-2,4,6-trideoxy-beta-L-altropyranose hydrolase
MRCLALAQAWEHGGGRAVFALAPGGGQIEARLRSQGISVVEISAAAGSAEDSKQTWALARRYPAEWLVLDGFQFPAEYRESIDGAADYLLLMDDHGTFAPYHCDVVLNTNPYASDQMYPEREERTSFLLGSPYALLRLEFLAQPQRELQSRGKARMVLVTLGGSDPHNVTWQVLQSLQQVNDEDLEVRVVVGPNNPHRPALEAVSQSFPRVHSVSDPDSMPQLMAWADLAISAGGGTCYELAFLRVPMLLITIADNHEQTVEAYRTRHAALVAGRFDRLDQRVLADHLRRMINDQVLRADLVRNAARMVDGQGAQRVLKTMLGRTVATGV